MLGLNMLCNDPFFPIFLLIKVFEFEQDLHLSQLTPLGTTLRNAKNLLILYLRSAEIASFRLHRWSQV